MNTFYKKCGIKLLIPSGSFLSERRSQNRYFTDKIDCKSLDFGENHVKALKLFWIVDYNYKVEVFVSNKFWKITQLVPEINAWIALQKCLPDDNLMWNEIACLSRILEIPQPFINRKQTFYIPQEGRKFDKVRFLNVYSY